MKVSMYLVKKWLSAYSPEAHILKGEQEILGVRYFTEDAPLKEEYLYIGYNKDFIETDRRGIICANSGDLILLNTEDLYAVFNEMQEMLEFYNAWEMNIMRMIEENADITTMLKETARVFGHGLILTDASHRMLGMSEDVHQKRFHVNQKGQVPETIITDINRQLHLHLHDSAPYTADVAGGQDILRNFFDGDTLIGWFGVLNVRKDPDKEALFQLTESFSRMLEFWFRINRNSLQFSNQSALFLDILNGVEADPQVISARMAGIGWPGRPEMVLANIVFADPNSLNKSYLMRQLPDSFAGSYLFHYNDDLLLIINLQLSKKSYFNDLKQIAKRYKASIGLSYSFFDVENLPKYYEQANIALRLNQEKTGQVSTCAEHAMAYLKSVLRKNLSTDISHPSLNKLMEYDDANGTDYFRTLGTYLLCERDQTRTAQLLHIHRNSLIYRVRKIQELLDLNLDDDAVRMYILMSFFMKEDLYGLK